MQSLSPLPPVVILLEVVGNLKLRHYDVVQLRTAGTYFHEVGQGF